MNYDDDASATIQISGTPRIDAQAGPNCASGIGLGEGDATVNVTITGGSFAQGDISAQTVGGQKVDKGCYVDIGIDKDFPYEVKQAPSGTVLVVPTAVTLQMGKTQQFTLVGASEKPTWSVSGNKDTNTQISETGLLTLGMNEQTDSTLIVTATVDGTPYTAQVTVQEPEYTVTLKPGDGTGEEQSVTVSRSNGTFIYTLPIVGTRGWPDQLHRPRRHALRRVAGERRHHRERKNPGREHGHHPHRGRDPHRQLGRDAGGDPVRRGCDQ